MTTASQSLPRLSDRWIPWYIAGFFLALVSILVPMSWIAIRTNPGVVTDNAYEKGLAYNHAIAEGAKEKILNWRGDVTVTPDAEAQSIHADFTLTDANGAPLSATEVNLWLARPTDGRFDKKTPMQAAGDGRYIADIPMAAHGLWDARVAVVRESDNYQVTKRIVLP